MSRLPKRTALFCAGLLAIGGAHAADGVTFGIGVDYSSGDYGTDTTTEILSVPFSARYATGNWTYKASVPWLRVSGDPNVLPGLGQVVNTNPHGRGRGGVVVPGTTPTEPENGTASGIGDLSLSATYSFDTGGPFGIDLTGKAKIATADEDKGLGTGANDYGLAVDVYRAFGQTTLFGGVGYTALGDSDYVDVDGIANASVGVSRKLGATGNSVGVAYDWRQAASSRFDDRSELTGFYSFGGASPNRFQVYATAGLSDGSPDWGGGVGYTRRF